ncbi:MAG: hypothetical protein OK439_02515 [Thaumarchaeota archaeon]|nr:hypothetical protein [Nitrososphaerota archaeon]
MSYHQMFIKIGSIIFTRSPQAQYTIQGYMGGSIGIRGRIQSEADAKSTEADLYQLREGQVRDIEVQTDDGKSMMGSYKINELNWKKERKASGEYELLLNIGLQKQ